MLDIKFIREHLEEVKTICKERNVQVDIDTFIEIDGKRLKALQEVEDLRRKRNDVADKMKSASAEERPALIEEGKGLKEELAIKEATLAENEQAWMELLLQIPNRIHPDAPKGHTDEENVVLRKEGSLPEIAEAKTHVELGKERDILDFEKASAVSGNKFFYLKGKLAILEQALIRFALDEAMAHGFVPLTTPDLAKDETIVGTGYNPRGNESQIYSIENQDISLIGTSEITLAGYHQGEVIPEEKLPIKYVGFSHCYRTESGAYGRESYGLYRVHQFSKVELFVFATPEQSDALHEELLRIEESFWKKLEIPYQVINICAGDLGAPAYRKYDIEAWMPGKHAGDDARGAYGEVTSASNCTDYQARRLGIRTKKNDGNIEFLHTLNGTCVATSRAMIAILENGQQADGSIRIPKALIPYCGFEEM